MLQMAQMHMEYGCGGELGVSAHTCLQPRAVRLGEGTDRYAALVRGPEDSSVLLDDLHVNHPRKLRGMLSFRPQA